jgi:hypothetical protein
MSIVEFVMPNTQPVWRVPTTIVCWMVFVSKSVLQITYRTTGNALRLIQPPRLLQKGATLLKLLCGYLLD